MDRFRRSRVRLEGNEKEIQWRRDVDRRLGTLADERIVIPRIGDFNVSRTGLGEAPSLPTAESARLSRGVKPFPPSIPLSGQQTAREKAAALPPSAEQPVKPAPRWHITAPRPVVRVPGVAPVRVSARINFPPGTLTRNIETILKSSVISNTRPLPALPDKATADVEFLPLETFDDTSLEDIPIETLLQSPGARSVYHELSGESLWEDCRVLEYDQGAELFTIEWRDPKRIKKVTRFNVRWPGEMRFEQRVAAAREAARRYEIWFRFGCRVHQMADEAPALSEGQYARIQQKAGIKVLDVNGEALLSQVRVQVETEYRQNVAKCEFLYKLLHNRLIPDRDAFLSIQPVVPTVPELEQVCLNPQFPKAVVRFGARSPLANRWTVSAVQKIFLVLHDQFSTAYFLRPEFPRPVALEEFVGNQLLEINTKTRPFKGELQGCAWEGRSGHDGKRRPRQRARGGAF
jgi:hypothetical protein